MTTTDCPSPAEEPGAHPAWQRAVRGPIDAGVAADLAEQVCEVPIEREWLLVCTQRSTSALHQVLLPAMIALEERWAEDLDFGVDHDSAPQGRRERRESFAALVAATAFCALTCEDFALAATMALHAGFTTPDAPSAALARSVITGAATRKPWPRDDAGARTKLSAIVAEYRSLQV